MVPTSRTISPLSRLWWLEPATLFGLVVGGTMLVAALQSEQAYLLYGAPKFIAAKHVLLAAGTIAAFAVGVSLARTTSSSRASNSPMVGRVVSRWFWAATALTLLGYSVWFAVGFKNGFTPGMLLEFLTTDDPRLGDRIRSEMFVSLRGITTCTQFGVGAVVLGMWLYYRGYRIAVWPIALLLALAAARALVFSERLALIELAVPAAVVVLRARVLGRVWPASLRWSFELAPVLGLAALVTFFGAFEYFRSWRYYHKDFDSYAAFTLWRVTGYYTTAHNNSAMAFETQPRYPIPYMTVRSLWSMPGLDKTPLGYTHLTGINPEQRHESMLERYGTPELNNEGGLFQPALDYGLAGLLLFWFGSGFVSGRLYSGFLHGTLAGLTIYPVVLLAILETPRLLYMCYTRSLPSIVLLLLVVWMTARAASPASEFRAAAPAPA